MVQKGIIVYLLTVMLFLSACVSDTEKQKIGEEKSAEVRETAGEISEVTKGEVLASIGKFIHENWDMLLETKKSLVSKNIDSEKVITAVNGWPITAAELEFRKGLRDSMAESNPSIQTSTYNEVFNDLVEEKLILSFAEKNGVLPTEKQIQQLIQMEKEMYNEKNAENNEILDIIVESGERTMDEYWDTYEWYNAFRLLAFENCHEMVETIGREKGEIPQKTAEDYWETVLLEYKQKADITIKEYKGLNLKVDSDD